MTISITPEILRAVAATSDSHIVADELNKRATLMEDPYHELIAAAELVYENEAISSYEGRIQAYKHLIDAVRREEPADPEQWDHLGNIPMGIVVVDSDENPNARWLYTRDEKGVMRVYADGSFGEHESPMYATYVPPLRYFRDV